MMTILVGIQNSILVLDSANGFKIHESLKGTIHKELHPILKNPGRAYCSEN
ncbi:hypothetical protein BH18THE2_BH18THE2_33280 [soil metagenome]